MDRETDSEILDLGTAIWYWDHHHQVQSQKLRTDIYITSGDLLYAYRFKMTRQKCYLHFRDSCLMMLPRWMGDQTITAGGAKPSH